MTTRSTQPAGGALLLSELKEFGAFPKATQRYIRRSLDNAFNRGDVLATWARDEGEASSIRGQARLTSSLRRCGCRFRTIAGSIRSIPSWVC
jgi:hypothetical protein